MADYPNFPQLDRTTVERRSGVELDIMESGVIRGSDSYDNDLADITVYHFLSDSDLLLLRNFSSLNDGEFITFKWDGDPDPTVSYNAIITSIEENWHASGNYFVTVEMTGNKN